MCLSQSFTSQASELRYNSFPSVFFHADFFSWEEVNQPELKHWSWWRGQSSNYFHKNISAAECYFENKINYYKYSFKLTLYSLFYYISYSSSCFAPQHLFPVIDFMASFIWIYYLYLIPFVQYLHKCFFLFHFFNFILSYRFAQLLCIDLFLHYYVFICFQSIWPYSVLHVVIMTMHPSYYLYLLGLSLCHWILLPLFPCVFAFMTKPLFSEVLRKYRNSDTYYYNIIHKLKCYIVYSSQVF